MGKKNSEKKDRNEYIREYREKNREKLAEYRRQYRKTHAEKEKITRQKYCARPDIKEKRRANSKKYYETHKNDPEYAAKRKAYHAEWQRKNKDRVNEYRRERRKKKEGKV